MIRITKLLAIATLFLMAACEQTDLEEPQVLQEDISGVSQEQVAFYPVMIMDYASAKAQLFDCESGISSYLCGSMDAVLELSRIDALFAIPRRPRHCPMSRCGFITEVKGSTPKVPGTICEPGLCGNLLKQECLESTEGLSFAVKAASLENVSAHLISGGEIITSTDVEFGGSISEGFECNSAQLNFGIPVSDIAAPGMVILVDTEVIIDGELVPTSFKIQL